MKTRTRVAVIGGGIAGCSTLYHLTREGWRDVVLIERNELTSGTTWHSAAQVTNFGMNQTMVGLKSHSIQLYKELSEDPDYPINYHHADGGIRLAGDDRVMDGYRHFASMAKGMGVTFEIIDAEECARRHPLLSVEGLVGGLWDPLDGDIDPAQLCQALARRARQAGAEIYRQTPVTGLTQRPDDSWVVHTDKGDIDADIVVNAGGYRVNEIGAMMGVTHPVVSMEHQYFLTEPIQAIVDAGHRMPLIRCPISDFYSRQEKQGLLVGFYEQGCKTWGTGGIDPNFANALCPDDLDRVTDVLDGAIARMPALAEAGIHTIVNGPITYTVDGAPLVGPIPGKRNAFCIIGLRAGLGEGGGHGWLLAQQIVHGDACFDTWPLDPRRFNSHATLELTALKAVEDYQNEFRFHFPHEYRPAGRPFMTTPLTPALARQGAEFGTVNGWERALYYKPGPEFSETHSFRFNETFDVIAQEVDAVQSNVGLAEVSGFTRIEIAGEGALEWLDGMTCSRIPTRPGKVGLCYFLNHAGMVKSEATIARLPDGRIWYGSAAAAELHDLDWLTAHLPRDGSVSLAPLSYNRTILVLAGPKSRQLLSRVSDLDWSAKAFPWLSVRTATLGAAPAVVMSVSYSGELAYEIHVPNTKLVAVYSALSEAGATMGLTHFGGHAIESMRLEKGYRHWKADLITEYNPFESALDRFIDRSKPEFIGKTALEKAAAGGSRRSFVSLVIDRGDAPAQPGDSVCAEDKVVGTITSAGWGHRVGRNIAMGFVDPEYRSPGNLLEVEIMGRPAPARVVDPCLYDPENKRVLSG